MMNFGFQVEYNSSCCGLGTVGKEDKGDFFGFEGEFYILLQCVLVFHKSNKLQSFVSLLLLCH